MKERGINIDFVKAQISIRCNHRTSIVPFSNVIHERGTLHTSEDVSLPPTCERLVECTISNAKCCPKDNITVYVHTWEAVSEKLGIRVAKGLGVIRNNKITKGLSNCATGLINLKNGTVVASYEEVIEKDWDVFDLDSKPVKHVHTILAELGLDNSSDLPQGVNIGSSQSKLSGKQLNDLAGLIRKHKNVFAVDTDNPGQVKREIAEHSIDVEEAKPISEGPRRTSPHNRQIIRDAIKKMIESGIIEPSRSPWAAPVVLVPKKTGEIRFAIDYRKLNEVTRKEIYPLPRIDDTLDALGGAKYFSTFDMAAGYWQFASGKSQWQRGIWRRPHL